MPGPELLGARATQAIVSGDPKAFQRCVDHPRWNPSPSIIREACLAAMRRHDAPAWLDALKATGMNPMADRNALMHAAVESRLPALNWFLGQGASPTATCGHTANGTPASAIFSGFDAAERWPCLVALWRSSGTVSGLMPAVEWRRVLARPDALEGLMALFRAGWDPFEPDSTEAPKGWAAWVLQLGVPETVRAWLTARRLEQAVPEAIVSNVPSRLTRGRL